MATCISDFTINRGLGKTKFDGISLRNYRRNWYPDQMSVGAVGVKRKCKE